MTLLERSTYVALIAVSCLSGWILVKNQFLHAGSPRDLTVRSLEGRSLALSGVGWERAPRTVVLVLSAQCYWCKKSVPLYQKVSGLHKVAKAAFQLIAVSAGTADELSRFLDANLIEVDRIVPAEAANLGVRATPTVLLVDRRGKVLSSWQGAMQTSAESAFLEVLRKSP